MSASVQKLFGRAGSAAGVATAVVRRSQSAHGSPRDHERETALHRIGAKPTSLLVSGIVPPGGPTSDQREAVPPTASCILDRITPGR